jgi:arylsulfatase A
VFQAEDGTVLCHSSQATVHGTKLQYEHNPKKITLGYWVNESDWAHWEFDIATAGDFDIEVLQGCGTGQGGSDVAIHAGGKSFPFVVEDTGHFQNFKPRVIGRVSLAKGAQSLEIRPIKKAKAAVMDVRQIRLVPSK